MEAAAAAAAAAVVVVVGSGFPSLALTRSSEKAIFRGPCNASLRGGTVQQSNEKLLTGRIREEKKEDKAS